jgi:hypothetical protein
MNAPQRYLLLFCLIVASDWTLIKGLNQPQYITEHSKAFVEQRWSASFGPLFNFARYNFNNNDNCCNGPTTSCCECPHAQGYLAGLHFDVTHSRPSHWYFNAQFDAEWNAGYVNNTATTFLKIKDYRPETDFGYTFFINTNHFFITPFTGLGFYYLSTEFKNQSLDNKYNNLYIPIGFNATWNAHPDCHENVVECFTAGINASYRIDAWTRLNIDTECNDTCSDDKCPELYPCPTPCSIPCIPIDYGLCDNRLKLNSRSQGVHVELVFTWFPTFNEKVNFIAVGSPFFDWNRFGSACATDCNGSGVPIPQISRWYLGIHGQLGIRF